MKAECVPATSEKKWVQVVDLLQTNFSLSSAQLRVLEPKMDDSRMSKKQEMCRLGAKSDMISNLRDNVIDQILIRLPIKDAVRTSVLSRKWRYKWTTITQLVFHDRMILPSPYKNMGKLINFIDRVLLLHTGCFIHKFELSSRCLQSFSTIDCWILFLLRKNIKEFVFKFTHRGVEKYKLPSCFFSAQQISTLELHGCVLKPPPTFTGFSNLKSLYLHNTKFVDNKDGFECLISKCPVLESLTWEIFDHTDDLLTICSPNLKYLYLNGCFQGICFENTPLLCDVSIRTGYLSNEKLNQFLQSETGNVVKVLSSLLNLRKFVMGRFFVKFLTVGIIPEKLPFTCHHLTNLSLGLNFEDVDEICVTLCLLNSSPNLRQLEIESNSFRYWDLNFLDFWEERTLIVWNMNGLQIVKITDIEGFESELEFIKLLLAKSPMLEMLSIRFGDLDIQDCKGLKFLKELLIFPRASTKAKIKFLDEHEE